MEVTEDIIISFLNTFSKKSCDKMTFYTKLFNFLEKEKCNINDELEIEKFAYSVAKKYDYIGYDVIKTISDDFTFFISKINQYIDKTRYCYFHFYIENEDEKELCFSEIWEKWKGKPSGGWLGGWCTCGHFFPYTLDFNAINVNSNSINSDFNFKPRVFGFDDIKKIEFCTDSNIRFHLNDGVVIAGRPFKEDSGFIFNFVSDPLSLI